MTMYEECYFCEDISSYDSVKNSGECLAELKVLIPVVKMYRARKMGV
jgi:hypothetical protein